jgi:hypothetical protein
VIKRTGIYCQSATAVQYEKIDSIEDCAKKCFA